MSNTQNRSEPAHQLAPFIIGISGHMRLPEDTSKMEALRERFRTFYRWLQADSDRIFDGLGPGLELKDTPIWIMTSLAPGVDQMAARVAGEPEFKFHVVAPLPFPMEDEQFLRSSSFDGASPEEKVALTELPHESFYVELAEETKMGPDKAHKRREGALTGDADKLWRYAHYRASGEYVAAHCDILLAVTDLTDWGNDKEPEPPSFDPNFKYDPGTPAIVGTRLHGITPGLLRLESSLPWGEVGPVVYLPWQKRDKSVPDKEGEFQFWIEKDPALIEIEAEQEVVQEVAGVIENFNQMAPKNWRGTSEKEFQGMLGLGEDEESGLPPAMERCLLRIAAARKLAKLYNYNRSDRVELTRERFLRFGVAITILLAIHGLWKSSIPHPPVVEWTLLGCFLAAVGLGIWTLILHFRFQSDRAESEQIDTRCIAEGLRAQFYWAAAGTGHSVTSNYLMRQRGAIRWITNTVSAASTPYEKSRDAFTSMPLKQRFLLLRRVVSGWIQPEGGEKKEGTAWQVGYFRQKCQQLQAERMRCQWRGWAFLLSGLWLAILLFFVDAGKVSGMEKEIPFREWFSPISASVLTMFGLIGVFVTGAVVAFIGIFDVEKKPKANEPFSLRKFALTAIGRLFLTCVEGTNDYPAMASKFRRAFFHGWKNPDDSSPLARWLRTSRLARFLWKKERRPSQIRERLRFFFLLRSAWPFSLLLALAAFVAAIGFSGAGVWWLPGGESFLTIVKTVFFAFSVRAFLTSKIRFHTENLRNYEAMLDLFRSGSARLESHLKILEARCNALPQSTMNDPEAERAITAIQEVLLALGREALSEHAEWLHLRRDRPVSTHLPNP